MKRCYFIYDSLSDDQCLAPLCGIKLRVETTAILLELAIHACLNLYRLQFHRQSVHTAANPLKLDRWAFSQLTDLIVWQQSVSTMLNDGRRTTHVYSRNNLRPAK